MNTKLVAAVAGAGSLILGSLFVPTVAMAGSAVTLEDMAPALPEPQSKQDQLPSIVDLEALGNISSESIRFAGDDDTAQYWIGKGEAAEIWLIMHIPENGISASTCAQATDFYSSGLALAAGESRTDPSSSAEAYLLPADINLADMGALAANRKSAEVDGVNLITVPFQSHDIPSSEVDRKDGSTFYFVPILVDAEQ